MSIGAGGKMIEYLIMDVDGTLTDGKIYMGQNGEAMKAFSIKDGYVINYILKPHGIRPVVLTARISGIVQNRCSELGIEDIYQGKLDKLSVLNEIVGEDGLGSCAYFGDDILDLKCMIPIKEAGGIVACPADAVSEVKAVADYICVSKAGEGALREFSEWLIAPKIEESTVKERISFAVNYLSKLHVDESDAGKRVDVNDFFYYCVQSYTTKVADECRLESHRKFIDVQIVIRGREIIEIADISRLDIKEDYNFDKDITFWNIPTRLASVTLTAGDLIILYPENAHRGAISVFKNENVLKIVGKVKII